MLGWFNDPANPRERGCYFSRLLCISALSMPWMKTNEVSKFGVGGEVVSWP
jgi:hypothetical protein